MCTPLPRRFWFRSTSHSSPSAGVPRAANGSIGCSTTRVPTMVFPSMRTPVGLPDVDAVQRVVDVVVDDRRPGAGHMDGGMIAPEVEARSADLEAVEDHVGGANLHRVRAAIAAEVRPPGAVQAHGAIDDERSAIDARRDLDCGAIPGARELRQQPAGAIRVRRRCRAAGRIGPGNAGGLVLVGRGGSDGRHAQAGCRRGARAWSRPRQPARRVCEVIRPPGAPRAPTTRARRAAAKGMRSCRSSRRAAGWSARSSRSAATPSRPA